MMDTQVVSRPQTTGGPPDGAPTPRFAPPDINAETYPFEVVQRLLDEAAYLSLFSTPDFRGGCTPLVVGRDRTVVGVVLREVLHRCDVGVEVPTSAAGVRSRNVLGEAVGLFESRWLVIPDGYSALPGRQPPPTPFDPARPQRLALQDGVFTLAGGDDGFYGFGTGATFPDPRGDGRTVLVAAVGNVMQGFGKCGGLEGTFTYCGRLDAEQGYVGHLLCRLMDPDGVLRAAAAPAPLPPGPPPEPGVTYLLFRGQKRDRQQRTAYRFGPDGQVNGLLVEQDLKQLHLDIAAGPGGELRTVQEPGATIGTMTAEIDFNPFHPGAPGTALAPVPFRSRNQFSFRGPDGATVGSVRAAGGEGRTFNTALPAAPGQRALRFGAFAQLVQGVGQFRGVDGLMADNSVVGIAPHAIATLYVFRIPDPDGRFRAAGGGRPAPPSKGWGPSPPVPKADAADGGG